MPCAHHSVLLLVLLLFASSVADQVVHVVTPEDLQQALLDSSVVHVTVTQHLDLANTGTLPFKVHGQKKTIRGACHEPSERLLRNNRGASQEEGSPQWKYLQCIISAPHSLFDVESEAKPSAVWISDLYILSDGIQHDVAQADSTALLHVERSDVWVTGVSFVAASGSMNRAVLLKDGAMFLGGCVFYGLELETPSPVLLLDTGTARFAEAAFSSIKGPPACGAMHVYDGAVALHYSVWRGVAASVEHDICLADAASRVYSDSLVSVTNLEAGQDASTFKLEDSEGHQPRFLHSSDSTLLMLVKSQVTDTAMLWPASVPRNSAGVTRESGLQQRATFIIVASAIAAVVVVLAAVLLLLLCRLRARRQQDTPEQKVAPSGAMEGSTLTDTSNSAVTKVLVSTASEQKPSERSEGGLAGMATDPGAPGSAHAESFVKLDSFLMRPEGSGSFLSHTFLSTDDAVHAQHSQTCPINGNFGPTALFSSTHINNSGRGLVRSTSAGACGPGGTLQTPRPVPRRKLARWNSLDACLAAELDSMSDKLLSRGTLHCSRPMASLQEEGHSIQASDDETLTLGNKKILPCAIYPVGAVERCTKVTGCTTPETCKAADAPAAPEAGSTEVPEDVSTAVKVDAASDADASPTAQDHCCRHQCTVHRLSYAASGDNLSQTACTNACTQ